MGGYGFTVSNDFYLRAINPSANGDSRAAGSVLLNIGVGPKLWLGGEKFSVSGEALAVFSPFALSLGDYKGLGMASFPMMLKLNFGGLTGLDKEGKFGLHVGGGIQYTRTELFYVSNEFESEGGTRDLFKTYIAQVGYGFGMSGFGGCVYGRYGWNADTDASLFSLGLQFDFNVPMVRKINNPESSL